MIANNDYFTGRITIDTDEGSLLPETYFYTHGTSRNAMLSRMQEKLEMTLAEAWVNRAPDLPYKTCRDALILASIIELETADSQDRREVAGVFVNRLRRGMRLQSDPTVLYGVEGGAGVKSGVPSQAQDRVEHLCHQRLAENTDMQSQSGIDRSCAQPCGNEEPVFCLRRQGWTSLCKDAGRT